MNGWLINMKGGRGRERVLHRKGSRTGNVPWHYDTLYLFSPNKDVIKNKFHFYVLAQARGGKDSWPIRIGPPFLWLPVTISHIPYTTSDATPTSPTPPLALMMPNFKGSTAQGISISCLRARVGLLDYTRLTPLTE